MSFKKWNITFVLFMMITGGLVVLFNVIVDPFGVFGDTFLNWYAYDMTNNPRVSKIAYLDKHHNEYDSYIIGCSKTSSFSTGTLNKYYKDSKFYNMLMYGGDMYDIEHTAMYIIENYEVKNLILNIGLEESDAYNKPRDKTKNNLHAKVDHSSLIKFYSKYLFQNPEYSYNKLREFFSKSYLPNIYSVFVPETGTYNKIVKDNEGIVDNQEYLNKHSEFDEVIGQQNMTKTNEAVRVIKKIKELCEKKGISFQLIASPVYYKEVDSYNKDALIDYWEKIASVTDFWDFSGYSSVSFDPRYFYDVFHFRTAVGNMALGFMSNDKSVYVPENFGHYTTKENVSEHAKKIFTSNTPKEINYTKKLPILMYHNISTDKSLQSAETITPDKFRQDMIAIKKNGFETVSFQDITDYVYTGKALPAKPIVITFDDGYYSNYQYAYPILKELGMKATITAIGMSVGKSTYKDTDTSIIPHFDYNNAKEMYQSGVIDIQSHSFAMHDNPNLETNYRVGVFQKEGESESAYIKSFTADYNKVKNDIELNIGNQVYVYAYPFGKYTLLSEVLLKKLGAKVSLTVDPGMNTLVNGLPQSLFCMKRINVPYDLSSADLVSKLNSY